MRPQEYPSDRPVLSFEEWLDIRTGKGEATEIPNHLELDHFETRPTYAEYVVRTWEDPIGLLVGKGSLNQLGETLYREWAVNTDTRLSSPLRDRAWQAFPNLFTRIFAQYCSPVLGHLSESNPTTERLDAACYMWWEVHWIPYDDERFFRLMETCLATSHPAVQESALHGLGHAEYDKSARRHVHRIIDRFLQSNNAARPELVRYAKSARRGHVL